MENILEKQNPRESYNSLGPLGRNAKKGAILKVIENSPDPIYPVEISRKTGIKRSTVRGYCRILNTKGFIVRADYGRYVSRKNLVTLGGVGPESCLLPDMSSLFLDRVHCLQFRGRVGEVDDGWCGRKASVILDTEFLSLKVKGYHNGTVIIYVDCKGDYSLDLPSFRLLIAFLRQVFGSDFDGFEIVSYEFNHDFQGVRLDGAKAVSVKTVDDFLRRAYQKKKDVVRVEAKAPVPLSVQQVEALVQGSVPALQVTQSVFALAKSVQDLIETQKYRNEQTDRVIRDFRNILEANVKALRRLQGEL